MALAILSLRDPRQLCQGMGTVIGTAEGCKTRSSAVPRHAEDAADTLLGRVALAEFAVLMRGVTPRGAGCIPTLVVAVRGSI